MEGREGRGRTRVVGELEVVASDQVRHPFGGVGRSPQLFGFFVAPGLFLRADGMKLFLNRIVRKASDEP